MTGAAIAQARHEAATRGYRLTHDAGCPLRTSDAPASACGCDSVAFVMAVSFTMAAEREAAEAVAEFARNLALAT